VTGGAQEVVPAPEPRLSPLALARTRLADGTYLKIHYGSPRKLDREIFGDLVPFGHVWRTAANESSELTVTRDVLFGGRPLSAGTYALYTIPGPDQWTIILNMALGQNGVDAYDASMDILRVQVPAGTQPQHYEAFTVEFENADGGADMVLIWDNTRVAVPIRTR
jgi:hypothetical protein